jgi:hypothetical protein
MAGPQVQKARRSAGVSRRTGRLLPRAVITAIDEAKILGVRAGARSDHRFTGVWVVVFEGRVFARSWTVGPAGWFHAFLEDPRGAIQVGDRQIRVRAVPVRSGRLRDGVERAYASKYSTPASRKWVRGFRAARRRDATVEFVRR